MQKLIKDCQETFVGESKNKNNKNLILSSKEDIVQTFC